MYKIPVFKKSRLTNVDLVEGQTIEHKIQKIMVNKEPIKDGAPIIFTERKEGVIAAYNIRTDRWEVATEAMDLVTKSKIAKTESKTKPESKGDESDKTDKTDKPEMKVVKDDKKGDKGNSGAESTQATNSK